MNDHLFTDKERRFFDDLRTQINNLVTSHNTAVKLIITQNDLAGSWRPKEDGSGLEVVPQASL